MPNALHRAEYEIFRLKLVQARENSGITQVEIAAKLKKPQSFVSKYERGERRLDVPEFIEIASVLSIDVQEFISRYQANLKEGIRTMPFTKNLLFR